MCRSCRFRSDEVVKCLESLPYSPELYRSMAPSQLLSTTVSLYRTTTFTASRYKHKAYPPDWLDGFFAQQHFYASAADRLCSLGFYGALEICILLLLLLRNRVVRVCVWLRVSLWVRFFHLHVSWMNGNISIKLMTVYQQQVHVTLMTQGRSLIQRSSTAAASDDRRKSRERDTFWTTERIWTN